MLKVLEVGVVFLIAILVFSGSSSSYVDTLIRYPHQFPSVHGTPEPSVSVDNRSTAAETTGIMVDALCSLAERVTLFVEPSQSTAACEIQKKYEQLGGLNGFLGQSVDETKATYDGVGYYRYFERGVIYWHPEAGAHVVHGDILEAWAGQNYETGPLGYPITDELDTPNVPRGRHNDFQYGSIYWTPENGASISLVPQAEPQIINDPCLGVVTSGLDIQSFDLNNNTEGDLSGEPLEVCRIKQKAQQLRNEGIYSIVPISDVHLARDRIGYYQDFEVIKQRGAVPENFTITFSIDSGAHAMQGSIRDRWFETFDLYYAGIGMPLNDQHPAPDNMGIIQDFGRATIYQSPEGKAIEMHGKTFDLWKQMGWGKSWLGFPERPEEPIPDDEDNVYQPFRGGVIYYTEQTGAYALHKQIRINFLSAFIVENHDPGHLAEWKIDMYSNAERAPLWLGTGLWDVDDWACDPPGSRAKYDELIRGYGGGFGGLLRAARDVTRCDVNWIEKKEVLINLPIEQGKLRIFSVGYEEDTASRPLPDAKAYLAAIPKVGTYVAIAYDIVKRVWDANDDDAIGLVDHVFTAEDRFGIGAPRIERSIANEFAGDLEDVHDTHGDWYIRYQISEVIPPNEIIVE